MATTPTIAAQHLNPISNLVCGATSLVGKEGQAVTISGSEVVLSTVATEFCLPLVAGNTAGGAVLVAGVGSTVPVKVTGVIAKGAELASNGDGTFKTAVSTNVVVAVALEASTATGDFILAHVTGRFVKA